MPASDLRKRLAIALVAAALPVAARALADSGDTGEGEDNDESEVACPADAEECFPWTPEIEGECPRPALVQSRLETRHDPNGGDGIVAQASASQGVFADGECCYQVAWECSPGGVGCGCSHGRPFLVERVPMLAGARQSRDWFDAQIPHPETSGLGPELRDVAARYWTSIALNEHASIASFHRVALELLAVGAPAELLAGAQRAALDEARHARRTFTLASHFAGAPIGPGCLPLSPSIAVATDRIALAVHTVREACVEETLSVAAAIEMRRQARDPAVCWVLDGIVRDEIRHAALAWRTIRWVAEVEGRPARDAIRAAFADAPTPRVEGPPLPALLASFGCVSDAALVAAAADVRRTLVNPLAERLCA